MCGFLAVLAGGALAGCDDRVIVDRDSAIPVRKAARRSAAPCESPAGRGPPFFLRARLRLRSLLPAQFRLGE